VLMFEVMKARFATVIVEPYPIPWRRKRRQTLDVFGRCRTNPDHGSS
jgi:hypothetical protein